MAYEKALTGLGGVTLPASCRLEASIAVRQRGVAEALVRAYIAALVPARSFPSTSARRPSPSQPTAAMAARPAIRRASTSATAWRTLRRLRSMRHCCSRAMTSRKPMSGARRSDAPAACADGRRGPRGRRPCVHTVPAFDRIGEENAFAVLARATALAAPGQRHHQSRHRPAGFPHARPSSSKPRSRRCATATTATRRRPASCRCARRSRPICTSASASSVARRS